MSENTTPRSTKKDGATVWTGKYLGIEVHGVVDSWRKQGRMTDYTPDEAVIIQKFGLNDGGKVDEASIRTRHRALVARALSRNVDVPSRVLDCYPTIEVDARNEETAMAKRTKTKKAREPRDLFGGGRVAPGDTLARTWQGKAVEAKVEKDGFSYTVDGSKPKKVAHLVDVVNEVFPRDKYSHHFSGWGFFQLKPAQIAARQKREAAAAAKAPAKAEAPKAPAKKAAKKPVAKKAKAPAKAPAKKAPARKASRKKAAPARKTAGRSRTSTARKAAAAA